MIAGGVSVIYPPYSHLLLTPYSSLLHPLVRERRLKLEKGVEFGLNSLIIETFFESRVRILPISRSFIISENKRGFNIRKQKRSGKMSYKIKEEDFTDVILEAKECLINGKLKKLEELLKSFFYIIEKEVKRVAERLNFDDLDELKGEAYVVVLDILRKYNVDWNGFLFYFRKILERRARRFMNLFNSSLLSLENIPFPDKRVFLKNLLLDVLMKNLSDRELEIIKLKYGLGGEAEKSIKKIASILDISVWQVRKSLKMSLDFLRRNEEILSLYKDFMNLENR